MVLLARFTELSENAINLIELLKPWIIHILPNYYCWLKWIIRWLNFNWTVMSNNKNDNFTHCCNSRSVRILQNFWRTKEKKWELIRWILSILWLAIKIFCSVTYARGVCVSLRAIEKRPIPLVSVLINKQINCA